MSRRSRSTLKRRPSGASLILPRNSCNTSAVLMRFARTLASASTSLGSRRSTDALRGLTRLPALGHDLLDLRAGLVLLGLALERDARIRCQLLIVREDAAFERGRRSRERRNLDRLQHEIRQVAVALTALLALGIDLGVPRHADLARDRLAHLVEARVLDARQVPLLPELELVAHEHVAGQHEALLGTVAAGQLLEEAVILWACFGVPRGGEDAPL